MVKNTYFFLICFFSTPFISFTTLNNEREKDTIISDSSNKKESYKDLALIYDVYSKNPSDINEHLTVLRKLSQDCSSVVELGIRSMVSTWGVLLGLAENSSPNRYYFGVDKGAPPFEKLLLAKSLARENGISFQFIQEDDLKITPPKTDLLFIDTYHTYCQLTEELEKFAPHTHKYIAMHDTSPPYGYNDEPNYWGNQTVYSDWIDREKKGLWPAVVDFLERHSDEWILQERRFNNHGFTVLKRISNSSNKTGGKIPCNH